jgi:hypothetical protein
LKKDLFYGEIINSDYFLKILSKIKFISIENMVILNN